MVNDNNINAEVMIENNKIVKLKELLPEMYISK